ncbi:FK506-binding protein 15 [Hyperolius riggenbachi]|uniref:FK506-binding protein 15 n=1 Tax=Hyperolius riggenbachi TaxID=752182 RepID=UPI0035A2DC19
MFGQDEEDADFLSPTGGAKLASLFGVDQMVSAQGNESFQYTAPKQPKKGAASAGTKSPKPTGAPPAGPVPSVLFATAVHAYKYVNGQYAKQGKFGAAVLGNQTSKEYRILLYISQQQPVTTAKIHPGFLFTVQLNNYAAFYDDQRQSWSVMFESEASAVDFSKQVCIAKCNSAPSLDAVIVQDLTPGDGPVTDIGDLLEVAYTGWLYQNLGIGQMFDSNVQKDKQLRLKLGSGKVIKGWEEGMLGMKKGGKRLLVIPPSFAYGSQGLSGRIPPNATLIFEIEVKRMKQKDIGVDRQSIGSRDSPVSITDSIPTESLPQAPTSVPPKPGEPAVRAKSNSISEQLADPNMQRISPHPAAPQLVRPTPQINQTPAGAHIPASVPQQHHMSGLPSPSAALIPVGPIASQAVPGQAPGFQPYTGIQYAYPPNPAAATQLQPVSHIYPAPVQQPAPYQASGDVTSFLMTEARQQNTEIRMAISKVVDKIDNLASKVDNLQKENTSGSSLLLPGISSITMESAMIMNNIQRIVQENERLKQEVLDKSSRIEEQNAKIGELIHRNQRYVEQSNMLMEQRNDSLKTSSDNTQAKMLHAMQEKAKVAEELSAATGQVSRLQLEVTAHQKREMELRTQLAAAQQEAEKCRTELTSVQVQLIEVKEASEQTRNRAKTEKESRRNLELRLAALEEEVSDLKVEKENLEKSLADRKRKSQQERQRAEEELEDLRRNFQEETENLRQLLKKTREQAAQEQLSSSSSRDREEQRLLDLQDQAAQLQPLKDKCSQLQNQITSLSEQLRAARARESDTNLEKEQLQGKVSQLQDKVSQLQPVRQKCSQLQAQVSSLTEQLRDSQTTDGEKTPAKDPTEEVKKIMNGVFQSLRKEFDLEETYSGRVVLGTIMNTIKATTLQLLTKPQTEVAAGSSSEEEEDEDAETEAASHPALLTEQIRLNKEEQSEEHKKLEELPSETPPPSLQAQPLAVETPPPALQAQPLAVATPPSAVEPASHVMEEEQEKVSNGHLDFGSSQVTLPTFSELTEVKEDEPVKVIQEDLDSPSALVHMISSDTPESSTVVYTEEDQRMSITEDGGLENSTRTPVTEPQTVAKEDLSQDEDLNQSKVSTTTVASSDFEESKREAPPPLGSDDESSSPVPPILSSSQEKPQKTEKKSSGPRLNESDEDDLFKAEAPKQKPKNEEEEDEEVSLKGRPPPAPLFGDEDEDDEDLDWLG